MNREIDFRWKSKKADTRMGSCFFGAGDRTRYAFSPMAKIMVRLGQALAGGAHPRRI